MATMICHICLRTDIKPVNIATELADFIDELCDYNIIDNPRYKFCTICAHILKKFFNFKQRCLKACKILKSLKGRQKNLPTNLHEQIPSSIGLCSTLARYKSLEHQYHSVSDQPNPDLIELKITPNNEVRSKNNLVVADPLLPDHTVVKNEPMQEELDHGVEPQVASCENKYVITTGGGYLTIDTNCEKEPKSIKVEADNELNTDTNTDGLKDNKKSSKINDYLKSFEEGLKDFDGNSVGADDTDVKDTKFMLHKDALRDNESLNSMDDIESDSDCDVGSLPLDEPSSDSDSDLENLSEIIEKAKDKKIKVNELYDLELAEILLTVDRKNKLLKRRVGLLKDKEKIRDGILKWFENDEFDLGDGVKISKEVFLKMYKRGERSSHHFSVYNVKDTLDKNKIVEYLRSLHKMYNPEYETVFDIEYLDTEEKKLQEFNRRKDSAEYQGAPYRCGRCYKGFHIERLHAYHMKKHEESFGPHECHICSQRFRTSARRRAHTVDCHSAVYLCRQCHVTFYYHASMENHFNLHKGKEFPCPICNGIYRTATGLSNHKRTHVTSIICTTCARSFVSAKGLRRHRVVKHKDAPEPRPADAVRCTECPLTLDSQKAYEKHLKISHSTRGFVCNCLKSFSSMAELVQHKVDAGHQHSSRGSDVYRKIHRQSRGPPRGKAETRTCPICQEKVPNTFPRALYQHHEKHHPGLQYQLQDSKGKKYLCEECGKQFLKLTYYMDHKNVHTGDRPYRCPKCPRAFATSVLLWSHSAVHRPPTYKCNVCGKLFHKNSNLYIHMRIHKNDRRFKCDICPASFLHATALNVHIRGVHQKQWRVKKRKQSLSE